MSCFPAWAGIIQTAPGRAAKIDSDFNGRLTGSAGSLVAQLASSLLLQFYILRQNFGSIQVNQLNTPCARPRRPMIIFDYLFRVKTRLPTTVHPPAFHRHATVLVLCRIFAFFSPNISCGFQLAVCNSPAQ